MTAKLNRFFALSALISLAVVSTASLADDHSSGSNSGSTLYVSEAGTGAGESLKLVLPIQEGSANYFTGSLNILTGSTLHNGSISNGTSFLAYCIDPFQWTSSTPVLYSVSSLDTLGNSKAAEVSRLYSQSYAGTSGSSLNSAAFQLALWELAKDDGKLASGQVHTTSGTDSKVVALASSMISNAKTGVAGPNQYAFNLYTSGKNQDYLVASMTSVTPVPEPETYAMMLAGLGLIGFTANRRRASRQG